MSVVFCSNVRSRTVRGSGFLLGHAGTHCAMRRGAVLPVFAPGLCAAFPSRVARILQRRDLLPLTRSHCALQCGQNLQVSANRARRLLQ